MKGSKTFQNLKDKASKFQYFKASFEMFFAFLESCGMFQNLVKQSKKFHDDLKYLKGLKNIA